MNSAAHVSTTKHSKTGKQKLKPVKAAKSTKKEQEEKKKTHSVKPKGAKK